MNWSFRAMRIAAREFLPVLIVLYPALLLLEDLEPGFVRSVVNPHAFLWALLVVATVAPRAERHEPLAQSTIVVIAVGSAAVTASWVWWRLSAGVLGVIVSVLVAVAVGAVILAFDAQDVEP